MSMTLQTGLLLGAVFVLGIITIIMTVLYFHEKNQTTEYDTGFTNARAENLELVYWGERESLVKDIIGEVQEYLRQKKGLKVCEPNGEYNENNYIEFFTNEQDVDDLIYDFVRSKNKNISDEQISLRFTLEIQVLKKMILAGTGTDLAQLEVDKENIAGLVEILKGIVSPNPIGVIASNKNQTQILEKAKQKNTCEDLSCLPYCKTTLGEHTLRYMDISDRNWTCKEVGGNKKPFYFNPQRLLQMCDFGKTKVGNIPVYTESQSKDGFVIFSDLFAMEAIDHGKNANDESIWKIGDQDTLFPKKEEGKDWNALNVNVGEDNNLQIVLSTGTEFTYKTYLQHYQPIEKAEKFIPSDKKAYEMRYSVFEIQNVENTKSFLYPPIMNRKDREEVTNFFQFLYTNINGVVYDPRIIEIDYMHRFLVNDSVRFDKINLSQIKDFNWEEDDLNMHRKGLLLAHNNPQIYGFLINQDLSEAIELQYNANDQVDEDDELLRQNNDGKYNNIKYLIFIHEGGEMEFNQQNNLNERDAKNNNFRFPNYYYDGTKSGLQIEVRYNDNSLVQHLTYFGDPPIVYKFEEEKKVKFIKISTLKETQTLEKPYKCRLYFADEILPLDDNMSVRQIYDNNPELDELIPNRYTRLQVDENPPSSWKIWANYWNNFVLGETDFSSPQFDFFDLDLDKAKKIKLSRVMFQSRDDILNYPFKVMNDPQKKLLYIVCHKKEVSSWHNNSESPGITKYAKEFETIGKYMKYFMEYLKKEIET